MAAGISVIPVKLDGSKIPTVEWKCYQERLATAAEVQQWFGGRYPLGLGIVTGRISGNLESIDFDDLALAEPWNELVEAECPGLTKRLVLIVTPRPGLQFWYRAEQPVAGNQALARGLRPDKNGKSRLQALIETRGEGGYAVAPGSPLAVHEKGTPYKIAAGDPSAPPVITAEERALLLRCARSLTEAVEPAQERTVKAASYDRPAGELRPGDDFNQREDLGRYLSEQGWAVAMRRGEVTYMRRPGKERGWSATLGKVAPGVLHVFTTSAAPLEDGCNYDLFRAYAAYEHGGNLPAAARALGARGYGAPPVKAGRTFTDEEAAAQPSRWEALAGEYEEQRQERFAEKADRAAKNGKAVHREPRLPELYSAADLQHTQLPELSWAVEGFLPEGVILLVAHSKIGKTFIAEDAAVAIALGGRAWGKIPVEQGKVIYVDTEGNKRRVQKRIRALLGGEVDWPQDLLLTHDSLTLDAGGFAIIRALLAQHPTVRLLVLDTLNAMRPGRANNLNLVKDEYDLIRALRTLGEEHRCAILLLHHRSLTSKTDNVNAGAGTHGLAAAANVILTFERTRGEHDAIMEVNGNDIEQEGRHHFRRDPRTGFWTLEGDADEFMKSKERQALFDLLIERGGMSPSAVASALKKAPDGVRKMMRRMAFDGDLTCDEGVYSVPQVRN